MIRVLVLAAVDVEARGLARHLGLAPVAGEAMRYRGGALEVLCVGPGAGRLHRAGACDRPDLVISAGACGALAPALVTGELVVPARVLGPSGADLTTWAGLALPRAGILLSVPAVVETPGDKARLWLETGAVAVDMESAPILLWAAERGIPAAVVRAVSDTADRSVPADVAALVEADGLVSRGRAARLLLRRPSRVAQAMVLGRGTQAALRRVAAALGTIARTAAGAPTPSR